VRWAVARRYARGLKAPATRWVGPAGPYDEDQRWADARRLLHDDALPVADRVAGLLILLYAQQVTSIVQLATDHIRREGERVQLSLGSSPVAVPAPLDALLEELVATRRTNSLIRTTVGSRFGCLATGV
jgi:hypothetical protein